VHSFVEFIDGAVIAQLGVPDMRVPIALAIADGERLPGIAPPVQLAGAPALEFFEVDGERFPAVALARASGETGGIAPAVLNAANEVAVAAFLERRLRFDEIISTVADTVAAAPAVTAPTLTDILDADSWARRHAGELVGATAAPA
jgi:1-deoxy-D-xylulose-5-phosphate reductoisomerase